MSIPNELIHEVVRKNCVLFVGSGLSNGAGLPNWKSLLINWTRYAQEQKAISDTEAAELSEYIQKDELLLVAQELKDRLSGAQFHEFMLRTFRYVGLEPLAIHQLITKIPFASIITTNYDKLIEAAYKQPLVITHLDVAEISLVLRTASFHIMKLHGDIDRITSLILTLDDYTDVGQKEPWYKRYLTTLLSTRTMLFVGFSLHDPDLIDLLEQLKGEFNNFAGKHFLLIDETEYPAIRQKWLSKNYGIKVIPYQKSAGHPQVQEFLDELKTKAEEFAAVDITVPAFINTPLDELSEEIYAYLVALGYTLSESNQVDSRTLEVTASLNQGTLTQDVRIRLIGGEISPEDVAALDSVLTRRIPQGWLISDRRVSERARDMARSNEDVLIEVFNLASFLQQKVWKSYFDILQNIISESHVRDLYVELECFKQDIDGHGNELAIEEIGSLTQYVDDWLAERWKSHISILGDFGSGKTWFCMHYAYRQLEKFVQNPATERLPLLITLRDFTKSLTAPELISTALLSQYKLPFVGDAYPIFNELNVQGKIFLILDGFDEMARQVNYQTMVDNFWELVSIVQENSKILLTSRTEYFQVSQQAHKILSGEAIGRRTENSRLAKFEVINIKQFSEAQIAAMIKLRVGETEGDEIFRRIRRSTDLAEMVRKPVLLELLMASLNEIDPDMIDNQAQLYLYATQKLLLRNIQTQRTFTSTSDKVYFLAELAWEMIRNNELRIHYTKIPEHIAQYFGDKMQKSQELDNWDYDLRNQTLLHRDSMGFYEFAHKSLAEFFVAFKLLAELGCLRHDFETTFIEEDGTSMKDPIVEKSVSELILTFGEIDINNIPFRTLGQFLSWMIDENCSGRILELLYVTRGTSVSDPKFLASNLIFLLLSLKVDLRGIDLSYLNIHHSRFVSRDLSDADFTGANLDDAIFISCNLTNANFSRTTINSGEYKGCLLTGSNFTMSNLTNAKLRDPELLYSLSWSPDGTRLAISNDSILYVVFFGTSQITQVFFVDQAFLSSPCWSTDGNYLAALNRNEVIIWDLIRNEKVATAQLGGEIFPMNWSLTSFEKGGFVVASPGTISFTKDGFKGLDRVREFLANDPSQWFPLSLDKIDFDLSEPITSWRDEKRNIEIFLKKAPVLTIFTSSVIEPPELYEIRDVLKKMFVSGVAVDPVNRRIAIATFNSSVKIFSWDQKPSFSSTVLHLGMFIKNMKITGIIGLESIEIQRDRTKHNSAKRYLLEGGAVQ